MDAWSKPAIELIFQCAILTLNPFPLGSEFQEARNLSHPLLEMGLNEIISNNQKISQP